MPINICCHFLVIILQITNLNFKLSPFCALLDLLASLCQGKTFGKFTDFSICSFMTIVDKYASSWRQEIKSQKGSGLKRFRPSSDWQIEEFQGTCDCKNESDLPTESFCHLVFSKKKIAQKQPETTATVALR